MSNESRTKKMPDTPITERRRTGRWRWIIGGVVVIAGVAGVWWSMNQRQGAATNTPITIEVRRTTFRQTVSSSGTLAPARVATLTFGASGQVQSIDVAVGNRVRRGQVLVRLDDRSAQLALQEAQADLDQRIATLAETQTISVTESDVAQAQANVAIAKAQLQAAQSSAAADIMSGVSNVTLAQTKQQTTQQGDVPAELQSAQLKVQEAQTNLEKTRDSASATKTSAKIVLDAAVDSLKAAQQKYSDAYWLNEQVKRTKRDPNTLKNSAQPDSGKLTDNQVREYQQALDAAVLAMQQATSGVQSAQLAYDLALQQEVDAVQQAEHELDDAQKNAATTEAGSIKASLVSAQDQVVQNQAALAKQRASNSASIASARGNVIIAQAKLDAAMNPSSPSSSAIASAQAQVAEGRANVFSAQQAVSATVILAPFDAIVSAVDVTPTATIAAGATAVSLIDMSQLTVDVGLSESDIVHVEPGLPVAIEAEALPGTIISGTVQTLPISPTFAYGSPSYPVRIVAQRVPAAVRLGMTIDLTITTVTHPNALVVPLEAIQSEGDRAIVQQLVNNQTTSIPVQLGQQNETEVEILSRLKEGDRLVLPQAQTDSNTSTGQSSGGGLFGGGNAGGEPPPP